MGVSEIDLIQSEARLEDAREKLHESMARLNDRAPHALRVDIVSDEQLRWHIDNCIKYECYIGARYLTEVLEKRK